MKRTLYGTVKNGEPVYAGHFTQLYREQLIPFEGKRVKVTIEEASKVSQNQRAYWHAVVLPIVSNALSDLQGEDISKDETHQFLKRKFGLSLEMIDPETGEIVTVIKSTGNSGKVKLSEMSGLIDSAIKWAAQYLNVSIPSPSEKQS